jgi:hypothetical protein
VNRFGILWRPLDFDLHRASRIVSACALLHNYIVNNSDDDEMDAVQSEAEHQYAAHAFIRWWKDSQHLRSASRSVSGARSDIQSSNMRDMLVARVKELEK